MINKILLATASFALFPACAVAQALPATTPAQDDIIVTGAYDRAQIDILQSTSVLKAAELQRDVRATIGDTLLRLPGISATSFGPAASRPVIRGQQGERVRVLTDGIGSIDASNTSVDHAVAGETLTAERVDVLRGPATLMFGSSGIGGVVNIIDGRMPASLQSESVRGSTTALFGSAATEWGVSSTINTKLTPGLVLHADASYHKSGDTRIGGPAISKQLAAQAGLNRDDGTVHLLANSDYSIKSGGFGATGYTNEGDDFFGLVVSRYLTNYGSPIEGAVRIDLKQTRLDMKAGLKFDDGFYQQAKFRFGWANYKHVELDDGKIGTTFLNKGFEARLDMVQRQQGLWRGAMGLQYAKRDFQAIGDEAFVPRNLTQQLGLFTLQEFDLQPYKLETSARFEHVTSEAVDMSVRRTFNVLNASFAGSYALTDDLKIGATVTRAVRAPSAEELFANGPHLATDIFEIGDTGLKPEKSWNAELYVHAHTDRLTLHGAIYHSWFTDYVFEQLTGAVTDDLPEVQYSQAKVRYFGLELQGNFKVYEEAGRSVELELIGDYVRATNATTRAPLPRIPALRLRGGVAFVSENIDIRGDVEWANKQTRITVFELPTDGYTSVDLAATWRPLGKSANVAVVLEANNLFDAEIRRHASFTKDRVPAAGRDIRFSLRFGF
jgi:iron complex outermembrane recepter protein